MAELPPEIWILIISFVAGHNPFDSNYRHGARAVTSGRQFPELKCQDTMPDWLLRRISAVRALLLVNRQLYALCKPVLYEAVVLEGRGSSKFLRRDTLLLRSLQHDPTLASLIRTLVLNSLTVDQVDQISPFAPHLTNMTCLTLLLCEITPVLADIIQRCPEVRVDTCVWKLDGGLLSLDPKTRNMYLVPDTESVQHVDYESFATLIGSSSTAILTITPAFLSTAPFAAVMRNLTRLDIGFFDDFEDDANLLPHAITTPGYLNADPPLRLEHLGLTVPSSVNWPDAADVYPGNLPYLKSLVVANPEMVRHFHGHAALRDLTVQSQSWHEYQLDSFDLPALKTLRISVEGPVDPLGSIARRYKYAGKLEHLVLSDFTTETGVTVTYMGDILWDFETHAPKLPNIRTIVYDARSACPEWFRDKTEVRGLLRFTRQRSCPGLELVAWGNICAWMYLEDHDTWTFLDRHEWEKWSWEWTDFRW